ncbi:hypothetical protein G7Y89_g10772 [Cudoniella acicularis]|uniref:NAD(P)-binding protein n=1 Tax=Cudoniella acicularis TaxID=354080 RepID=A0A8H4REF8_9HELO|nr:hypothetical protein G7Y89_g10772 [Cudoniella acicularis]
MSMFESLPRPTKTYHSTTYDSIAKHNGFDGKGKTILITGGASGVGYSISKAFAEAGVARIAIISRSPGPQEKTKAELETAYPSTQILPYQADVTDSIRVNEILQDLGTIDVLILGSTVAHFAAFNITKAYLATPLPVTGRKTIINISSATAQVHSTLRVGYGSSKGAVTQVKQHFALERESEDLKIFSFHPGAFYTPLAAQHFAKDAMKWDDLDLPAHFALWLAGPESSFLNGRYMWANWDVDELVALKDKLENNPRFLTIGLVL